MDKFKKKKKSLFFLCSITSILTLIALLCFPVQAQNIEVNTEKTNLCYQNDIDYNHKFLSLGLSHRTTTRQLNSRPSIINVIKFNPSNTNAIIRPSYGSYALDKVKNVKDFVALEKATVGINASFFKPDTGAPLGASILNGEILTGPLYKRVVFGITENNQFKMEKLTISGKIKIGEDLNLELFNINQPVFSPSKFTIFTDRWGKTTPPTSIYYCHIVVSKNKVQYIKQSSVPIPKNGYVIVGPRKLLTDKISQYDPVDYQVDLNPSSWNNVKYAVSGGPYLIKNGEIFIDKQRFSDSFITTKAPRTALGFTKKGTLILVTIDGRQTGISEGATILQLAKIMQELGAYNAMNLDGGSSTQLVYRGEVGTRPTIKGGGKVTNALVIIEK